MSAEADNRQIEMEKAELEAKLKALEAEKAALSEKVNALEAERSMLSNDLGGETEEAPKSDFQVRKENWYDKINVTVKQLDIVIGVGIGILVIVFILIILEANGIFALFPKN